MKANYPQQRPISAPPLWPWLVVLACAGIAAAGVLALIGWIVLAILGY